MATNTEAMPKFDEELIYPGFKFDVYKIADDLFIVKDQVTRRVREVENFASAAIDDCRYLDMRAGWEEFDNND